MADSSHHGDGIALRPRARILRTLGEELISSEIVAILELVKNSYDADARQILVRFVDRLDQGHGTLEVADDGHGMDMATVRSAWMEPATDIKKKARLSKHLKRRLLGEKGVGRFATARLAAELELITRTAEGKAEIYALFDWTQFDRDDLYLDEVLILAEERTPRVLVKGRALPVQLRRLKGDLPRDGSHGTVLRMNHLKRTWNDKELNDLRRGLSRLVSPFETERDFRIFLQLPGETASDAQEVEPPEVIKYPHYSIAGTVASDGRFGLTIRLHKDATDKVTEGWFRHTSLSGNSDVVALEKDDDLEDTKPVACGPLAFRILVWDRDQLDDLNQKLGTGIRSIRKDLDSVAGISIYRDGFRVLPFGEPDDDWLRLDIRRVQNPTMRLSNNQLTGYITIGADTNPLLRDQSNREGLDNNDAYADLQSIMLLTLSRLEALRYREKKAHRPSASPQAGGLLDPPDVDALRERLRSQLPGDDETIRLFEDATKHWEEQIVRIRDVLSRYHSLATLGQLVDKVVHDSRQPLSTVQGQAALAQEMVAALMESHANTDLGDSLKELAARLLRIREAAGVIDGVLRRIEPLGGRNRGRPGEQYLEEIIRSAFAHYATELDALDVKITLPRDENRVRADPSELQQVIINLLSNSLHWLKQVPKSRRAILVQCTRLQAEEVEIIFADSGPGIPAENRQSIFDPYFTTRPNGVGLGLVIAGEIIRDYYNGTLELLDSGPLGGAVFRIVLRKRV